MLPRVILPNVTSNLLILRRNWRTVTAEGNEARAERDAAIQERDKAQAERDTAIQERDDAIEEGQGAQGPGRATSNWQRPGPRHGGTKHSRIAESQEARAEVKA